MYRLARSAMVTVALLFLGAPRLATSDPTTITILSVGDTHSHLDAVGPKDFLLRGTLGGLSKAASVIGTLKAEPNTVLVHAGDLFNEDLYFVATLGPGGTPMLSVPELQLLAGLGLDVMTLGNHEFGLGPDVLAGVLTAIPDAVRPSVLSANIDTTITGAPALNGLVLPHVIKDIGGVPVGFFGLTIVDFISQGPWFTEASLSPEGLIGLANNEAATLRLAGAKVVVCIAHLGLALEEAIAANAPVDAVIGAHDHLAIAEIPVGSNVPLVKSGEFYKNVGKVTLTVENGQVTSFSQDLIPINAAVPRLPQVYDEVRKLQVAIDLHYGEPFWSVPLAFAPADLSKDADPTSAERDTAVANLITDALRSAGRTDMGLTVNGFLPDGLTHGFIVRDDAFRIVGDGIDPDSAVIGFPLYRIKISGENLVEALETALESGGDLFIQGSGLAYTFNSQSKRPRVRSVSVDGQPVNPKKVYSATVNFGVVKGLNEFPNVRLATRPQPLGLGEYAAVRDWMKHLGIVFYNPEGRIIDVSKLPP